MSMNLTINDARNLSVFVVDPTTGACYNWKTGVFETFNAAAHVVPIPVVPNLPDACNTLKNVMVQEVLAEVPNARAVIVTVDATGNPVTVVDVISSPFPVSYPTTGGVH